jgi:hypothetical protein
MDEQTVLKFELKAARKYGRGEGSVDIMNQEAQCEIALSGCLIECVHSATVSVLFAPE